MKRIVWLASYPKSGNTWFRAFLANLLRDPAEPVDINKLETGGIASGRQPLDASLGYDSSNLAHDEIDLLRRDHYLREAAAAGPDLFVKTHDACTTLRDGALLFPPEATKCVLYLIRNPLDVCVSYSHHSGRSEYDRTAAAMGRPGYAIAAGKSRQHEQLRQVMGSWSEHVRSWADATGHRVHVIRYEDMKASPQETFAAAARFAGLPSDPQQIAKALKFSSFEELSRQEAKNGFKERLHHDRVFFRQGRSGSWRGILSAEQTEKIVSDQREIMARFGYLDADGRPSG